MIGHIQTNKIKDFLPFVHLVHGVDRMKVLDVMQKEAAKLGRHVNLCFKSTSLKKPPSLGLTRGIERRGSIPRCGPATPTSVLWA